MRTIKTVLLVILSTSLFFNCDNDNDPTNNVCDENYVNTAIIDVFSTINGYDDVEFLSSDFFVLENLSQGISKTRISGTGYGETQLLKYL